MVTSIEVGLLVLVVVAVVGVYLLSKLIKPLVINAIAGLIVLFVAGWLGYGAAITPIVLLLVAFGGLPAAIIVILLAQFGILFDPAFLVPLL